MDERIRELAKLWVQWNCKQISGDDFAYAFRKLFKEETAELWERHTTLARKIKAEMVKT